MSEELQSALLSLTYPLQVILYLLIVLILSKTFNWFGDNKVVLDGKLKAELSGELKTAAADNYYTEVAAGKHTKAAELNLKAQEAALKTAEANERTEQLRLERARLENPGKA